MKKPLWVVLDVEAFEDYTLIITFASGEKRKYNALNLLEKNIYSELKNMSLFLKAKALYGTVIWSEDIDIAPEHLYSNSTIIN